MSGSFPRAARVAAVAAFVSLPHLLAATPAGAQPLRRALARVAEVLNTQLATAVADDGAGNVPQAPPRSLRRCGTLYDQNVRRLLEGPEMMRSAALWLEEGMAAIERTGGLPLPVCFEWKSDSVDTRLARTLLSLNTRFMGRRFAAPPATELERRYWNGYVLTGHTDPVEADTALARGRAESVQARSPGPPCRFVVRVDPLEMAQVYHRKVTYSYQPAVRSCPRAPH